MRTLPYQQNNAAAVEGSYLAAQRSVKAKNHKIAKEVILSCAEDTESVVN
jgi:hypothetical protein